MTPENIELVNSVISAIKGAGGKLGTDGGACGITSPAIRALKKGRKSV